jgi:nicotinamidase-related amidase
LLIVDPQERLLPTIPEHGRLVWNLDRLLRGAKLMSVPTIATVQYPKGLGPIVAPLRDACPKPVEKLSFSGAVEAVLQWRAEQSLSQVVIGGIETHVCILQTALDLLAAGVEVFLAVDALGARYELDHRIALERLHGSGITLSTVEGILFEWCETAADEQFKGISAIVREVSSR